ncbi:MAG: 50S ribosome-binding GTPase [Phycisphaerales bacterium]|nr:MAG: 50S ribosome-binding GTPase [Phycisphaerales bacterium]
MYELNDTIVAVSSPTSEQRVIVRLTGPDTFDVCGQIRKASFNSPFESLKVGQAPPYILPGSVVVDEGLEIDVRLYVFPAPHSYTGDDVAEIHTYTNCAVTEALISSLLKRGLRTAQPGEFTARAYLNGKLDLAQAEAVNEIIISSNAYQLAAAQKLLEGRLGETTAKLRHDIMDLLSLIEAGLDFGDEDIELIAPDAAIERLVAIRSRLELLLSGSINLESLIDLPAVGIAGAPNAGKSSLLNTLLGEERSIVSHRYKTTRDVLTGVCTLAHNRCVLFDCAGLLIRPEDVLDELAQQAAIEALRHSAVVIFCADASKTEWSEDAAIRKLIESKVLVPVATKSDLVRDGILKDRLSAMNQMFSIDFMPISARTGAGIERLRRTVDGKLTGIFNISRAGGVALTARHKQVVAEAIEHVGEAIDEFRSGNDEVAAMTLRAAYHAVSEIEQPGAVHIDEQILGQIFNRFCIGK